VIDLGRYRDRPWLLDVCCAAGGAAAGYERCGFYVVGVGEASKRWA
jgi:hypothetical protein